MAPKPPKKAKGGGGHSYVSKDKGDAKAKLYKMSVAEWLHEDAQDAELLSCLTRFAELNLWKEFAQTLGRAWVTNGKDAVVGHFLTHAEPAIVKDLWRIYQDGPPRDQEYELGTPVRVLFDDGLWYAGLVTHFNVATSKYSIQFDDGDQMDMRIPDKDVEVVSRDELEASKKRAAEDDAGGERKACEKEANDGIMLGSNAYRYHNAAGNAAVRPPDAVCPAEGALECEAAHVQRQADEAARVAADDRRRELAAKKKSTFVATAFREPGPKKAAHAARKLGKKSKSVESGKQGKKGMQKKYKFKNKNFK